MSAPSSSPSSSTAPRCTICVGSGILCHDMVIHYMGLNNPNTTTAQKIDKLMRQFNCTAAEAEIHLRKHSDPWVAGSQQFGPSDPMPAPAAAPTLKRRCDDDTASGGATATIKIPSTAKTVMVQATAGVDDVCIPRNRYARAERSGKTVCIVCVDGKRVEFGFENKEAAKAWFQQEFR